MNNKNETYFNSYNEGLEGDKKRQDNLPCSKCHSSDAVSVYLNRTKKGRFVLGSKCFSCGCVVKQKDFKTYGIQDLVKIKPTKEDEEFFDNNKNLEVIDEEYITVVEDNSVSGIQVKTVENVFIPKEGFIPDNNYRGVSPKTFEKYSSCVRYDDIKDATKVTSVLYPFYSKVSQDEIVAQKRRDLTKDKRQGGLLIDGKIQKAGLFGHQLFNPENNRRHLLICEGELDAMSAFQMLGAKYAVVSVRNGAQSLTQDIKQNFIFVNAFEDIRICFDPDEAGNEAVKQLCESGLLDYGKLKIVRLNPSIGDTNDYLQKGQEKDFVTAFWNAQDYQPEGVVLSSNLLDTCLNPPLVQAYSYPFDTLQSNTYGMRFSEFDTWGARSGIGKTSILKEFTYKILKETNEKVGLVLFEEPTTKTLRSLVGLELNKRIDLPDVTCSKDEFVHGWEQLGLNKNRVSLWDVQVNSWELDPILKHIEFMVATQDIKFLFVDFLQCIKTDVNNPENERLALDKISETFAKLAVKKNIHISATTQLNRSTGEIRGSSGIEQFSHKIVFLERDKKHQDERMRRVTKLVVDKNRFNGTTGPTGYLEFNPDTGRLVEQLDITDEMFEGKVNNKDDSTATTTKTKTTN